jgi:hypothetical protein
MESKKINQLATELTPALDDITIIGDPTTGISKKITLSQMASLFTGTVEEYANFAAFPLVGVADTIYIALDTNVLYRWNTGTNAYVELSPNIINSLVFSDANGFDGNISLVGSTATLTITTALTTGSVPFIGASGALSQDNANLFFDDTNNRLGINTNAPTTALDVFGSGIIGRLNGTSTNNAYLGFASAGTNKWSIGNVQSDHRFRIYNEATTSELVSVLSTGEFGIGIANPTTKVHIDGGASALIANLDANVSVAKSISFRSDNSNRINLEVSGTESGSNAGANFFIRRYSDAGALIDTPLTITRSTGVATFGTSIVIGSGSSDNSLNIYGSSGVGLLIFETSTGTNKRLTLTQTSTSVNYNATFGSGPNQHVFQVGNVTKLTIADTTSTFANSVVFDLTTTHTGVASFGIGGPTAIGTDGTLIIPKIRLYASNPASIYHDLVSAATSNRSITIPDASGTMALTSNLSAYLPLSGGTLTGTLNGTAANFAGNLLLTNVNPIISFNTTTTVATTMLQIIGAQYVGSAPFNSNRIVAFNASSITLETSSAERIKVTETAAGGVIFNHTGGFETRIQQNSQINAFYNGGGGAMYLNYQGNGGIYAGTSLQVLYAGSDRRIKSDINNVESTLNKILNLIPRTFKYKDRPEFTNYGFIAQEVEEIMPELVRTTEGITMCKGEEIENQKSVESYGLVWASILVKAIQEQQKQIEELKTLINK